MAAQRYYYSDTIADFLIRGTNATVGSPATHSIGILYPRCRQGLSKEMASLSKLFELAIYLGSAWER